MAGSYIPLIGADNVAALVDASAAAIARGTVNGVAVDGRSGQAKTVLLVALDNASTPDVPATTSALLFSLTVACPPGFSTPASAGDDGADYSAFLPVARAECLAKDFNVTGVVWPVDVTALIAELATLPPNVAQITGRLTAMAAPSTAYPYGTMTFAFSGASTTAAVTDALIQVSVDFGASVAN